MKAKLNRISFLITALFALAMSRIFGRGLALNATPLTPTEISALGIDSLDADTGAIAFKNAVVKKGTDDRHFAATSAQADIPYGVILNDEVASGEEGVVRKNVAVFGLYGGSIPCVTDGSSTIAVTDRIVVSAATAGKVKKMPSTSGQTYIVIGRPRFAVAATDGDPVSLVHCVPYAVTNP
jgi:hypothetical protein